MQEVCRAAWHSGVVRRDVGIRDRTRAQHRHVDAAGFTLPGDVSASKRYWDEDIIEPAVEVTARGTIRVPTAAGLGYAVRRDRIRANYRAQE